MRSHPRPAHGAPRATATGARAPRHRRASRVRPLVLATGGVVAATAMALVLGGTSGTHALWADVAEIPAATITTGGVDLTIAAGEHPGVEGATTLALPDETWSTLLPGDQVGTPLTVTNAGHVPALVSASLDPQAAGHEDLEFLLSPGACSNDPTGNLLTDTSSAPLGPALATGADATYCLWVTLSPTTPAASQGSVLVPSFVLTLTGTPEGTP